MHSLIKFILRHSNFLVFLLLEVVAFLLIVNNQDYPKSSTLSTANNIVAWQYKIVDEIGQYFYLSQVNEALNNENAQLRTQLAALQCDTPAVHYHPAKVVDITTYKRNNYLTINKGKRDGVQKGMGVINHDGVVGIIRTVGEHYSVAIPIINSHAGVSCRIQKNDYITTTKWIGGDIHHANLEDVASHIIVEEGDTIITSGLTPIFPKGIPVGIVEKCTLKDGDSYYSIRIRLLTNYKNIEYVQLIANPTADEQNMMQNGLED